MKFSKIHIFIFLTSFIVTTFLVWILLPSNKSSENMYFRESYDFHKLRLNNPDINTLKIGEKLNIANIKNPQGKALSSLSNEKLFLLIATDPFCPACNFSMDMIEHIRLTTVNIKIAYYPISITQNQSSIEMDKYANNFGFSDYFYWSSELPAPNSLTQLITPTHILIDKNGTVLQVWYGSNKDRDVRRRMSNQISADLLLVRDVFEAVSNN